MRVNRRFLYWGIFLAAVGGVLVAVDLGNGDTGVIADALRFWPLAIVAIGLGLALRRTRFSLLAGVVAAAMPGLVLGGSLALAPRLAGQCGGDVAPSNAATQQGTFDGAAQISVSTGCGDLVVGTAPGSGWRLDARDTGGRTPVVDASAQALSIKAGGFQGWHAFGGGRDTWQLTLPTSAIDRLFVTINAGEGRIGLPGATIGRLELDTNAGHTTVDLSQASVASLSGTVDAGVLSIHLPANADLVGSLDVNAGALQVCAPSDVGLRIHHVGALSALSVNGSQQNGTDWSSPDYGSAAHHADLNVTVNLGGVEIDPIGGCK